MCWNFNKQWCYYSGVCTAVSLCCYGFVSFSLYFVCWLGLIFHNVTAFLMVQVLKANWHSGMIELVYFKVCEAQNMKSPFWFLQVFELLVLRFCGGPRGIYFSWCFFLIFPGIRSLEHHSVSGSSSVQRLSELVAEKMVKYLQQEGLITY